MLDRMHRMRGGFAICTAMSGNGAKIGMEHIRATLRIRLDRHRVRAASFAAVVGTATRGTAAPRFAPGSGQAIATTSLASASFALKDRANEGRSGGVHSQICG